MNRLQKHLRSYVDRFGPWESRYFASLPRKQRALLAICHPVGWARDAKRRFDLWTVLPGDVWQDFQRNTYYVVRTVKPSDVAVLTVSGWDLHAVRDGRELLNPPMNEVFSREDTYRWCHVAPDDAATLRALR